MLSLTKLESNQVELLKWIAIISMVVDHLNKTIFHSENLLIEGFGRIAFPLFAFLIAHNYIFYSKNKEKYLSRLFVFAIISQPFYYLLFHFHALNILFTLFLGTLNIYLYEKLYEHLILDAEAKKEFIISYGVVNLVTLFFSLFVDYYFFGVYLIVFIYFMIKKKLNILYLYPATYLSNAFLNVKIAPFAMISAFLIQNIDKVKISIRRTNKWFFYLFYPVHLILLLIISKYFL